MDTKTSKTASRRGITNKSTNALSREVILAAALELIDQESLEALSMRRLGAALGVEAMSLYHYFKNRDALLDGVVEVLMKKAEASLKPNDDWREKIRTILRAYREAGRKHPNAFPLAALRPLRTPHAVALGEVLFNVFREAGLSHRDAVLAFRTLGSFINGFVLLETSNTPPAFTTGSFEGEFAYGMEAIICGIETTLLPKADKTKRK